MVGAVVLRDGEVVGQGYHRQVGGPHAEVEALRQAGEAARGATLYVTLEPCAHQGRTPPCTDAVLRSGVSRVVACHRDPDPRVAGGGFERLRRAGVSVETGELLAEAVRLNWRYLVARVAGRPAVTLKWAMSLDGRIATASGESQWISGPGARRWALELREEHDAVVVGSGTVLADDPRLNRRLGLAAGPGLRVVLDRRLRTPPGARLFQEEGPVLLFAEAGGAARERQLARAGAEVVRPPRVTPAAVLAELAARGVQSVLVEGGAVVHGAFLAAGLYDRVAVACAPLLIGGATALGPVGGRGLGPLRGVPRLERPRVGRRGDDLIVTGFRTGCLPDLSASVGG